MPISSIVVKVNEQWLDLENLEMDKIVAKCIPIFHESKYLPFPEDLFTI